MIYLSSPYTHPNPEVVQIRYHKTLEALAYLLNEGMMVFSPIAHCHEAAVRFKLPTDFNFWARYNEHMVGICEELWVLRLEGWELSIGVQNEINMALNLKKEVAYIDG